MNRASQLVKLFESLGYAHSTWDVFRDFLELAAIAFSNAVDLAQRDAREKRYLETAKKYSKEQLAVFPQILGALTLALEEEPADVLGQAFMDMDLGSKWHGQFFTPQSLADAMGLMSIDKAYTAAQVKARGFITVCDPAVGGGSLLIGAAKAMKAHGFNYQRHMHVTGIDVDEKAVHMAYLQLSLLGVPAVLIHGNTLTLEERAHWYTPAHIFGLWSHRLKPINAGDASSNPGIDVPSEPVRPRAIKRKAPPKQLALPIPKPERRPTP